MGETHSINKLKQIFIQLVVINKLFLITWKILLINIQSSTSIIVFLDMFLKKLL